ncbi:MAG: hemerythrin domain-containing protein [Ilumatobacteraceae bacterium]
MTALTQHLHHEHRNLEPHLESILAAAHAVGSAPHPVLRDMTDAVLQFVLRELDGHARSEDEVLYDAVERATSTGVSIDTLRREHVEINRLSAELSDLHGSLVVSREPSEETTRALRRVLYGLHAVISLHFAKENEILVPWLEAALTAQEQDALLGRLRSLAA